eukprot:TRINITY_DN6785_c0_g1_i1.p1 TRINITY_DN6785_c0_g1~~TRINITY_DN6785_c0_g1_i1.p1  ORF type:complete len:570 (+),score=88.22 TRINITY_DN6785_c0_g1_i1:232-1710(+)
MVQIWAVHAFFMTTLEKQSLINAYEKEMPIAAVLSEMEVVGVGFDESALSTHKKQIDRKLDSISEEVYKKVDQRFNLASPLQVSGALFDTLKLMHPTSSRTTKGAPSTDEKVLKALNHPVANLILQHRHLNKMLTTYVNTLESMASFDKKTQSMRLHSNWHQTVVVTGRLSSSNPNLQNLPKNVYSMKEKNNDDIIDLEDKGNESPDSQSEELQALQKIQNDETETIVNVRDAIVSREGYTLVGADYSQIEIRILAHITKDPVLIAAYKNKEDIHRQISAKWLGKRPEDVTDKERERAKRIVFGVLYGMSAQSLAEMINVKPPEARKFIKEFLGKYPNVKKFISDTVADAKTKHEIKTYSGRRRVFSDFGSVDFREQATFQRQAVNSVIQGSASDVIKIAMLRLQKQLRKKNLPARIVLQVHDELVVEVRDDYVEVIKRELKEAMETATDLFVPLEVSMFVGKKWGSMKSVKMEDSDSQSSSSSTPKKLTCK